MMPVFVTTPATPPNAISTPGSGGSWYVSVPPNARVVTPDEMRRHCRIDDQMGNPTDEDLSLYLDAAVEYAESAMSCSLMPRTITATFYEGQSVDLPRGPVINVVSVADGHGNPVTAYSLSSIGYIRRMAFTLAAVRPLVVTYRAGYALANGTTPAVPADIKLAILQHAATLYENRESISEKTMVPVPHSLEAFYARKCRSTGVR